MSYRFKNSQDHVPVRSASLRENHAVSIMVSRQKIDKELYGTKPSAFHSGERIRGYDPNKKPKRKLPKPPSKAVPSRKNYASSSSSTTNFKPVPVVRNHAKIPPDRPRLAGNRSPGVPKVKPHIMNGGGGVSRGWGNMKGLVKKKNPPPQIGKRNGGFGNSNNVSSSSKSTLSRKGSGGHKMKVQKGNSMKVVNNNSNNSNNNNNNNSLMSKSKSNFEKSNSKKTVGLTNQKKKFERNYFPAKKWQSLADGNSSKSKSSSFKKERRRPGARSSSLVNVEESVFDAEYKDYDEKKLTSSLRNQYKIFSDAKKENVETIEQVVEKRKKHGSKFDEKSDDEYDDEEYDENTRNVPTITIKRRVNHTEEKKPVVRPKIEFKNKPNINSGLRNKPPIPQFNRRPMNQSNIPQFNRRPMNQSNIPQFNRRPGVNKPKLNNLQLNRRSVSQSSIPQFSNKRLSVNRPKPPKSLSKSKKQEISKVIKVDKAKGHILQEFVETEEQYLNNLHVFKKLFVDDLQGSSIIDKTLFSQVFGEFLIIIPINEMFVEELKKDENVTTDINKFCEIVNKMSHCFKLYSTYISKYEIMTDLIETEKKKNVKFREFIDKKDDDLKTSSHRIKEFTSYLILPIQRIPRYKLLIDSLLKQVKKVKGVVSDQTMEKLEIAYKSVCGIAQYVDVKAKENKLNDLVKMKKLADILDIRDLILPHRHIVLTIEKGCRASIKKGDSNVKCNLYLFTDIFAVLIKKKGKKKLFGKSSVEVETMAVSLQDEITIKKQKDASPEFPYSIKVVNTSRMDFYVRIDFRKQSVRNELYTDLETQINEVKSNPMFKNKDFRVLKKPKIKKAKFGVADLIGATSKANPDF